MQKKLFSVHTGADAAANKLIAVFKDEHAEHQQLAEASDEFIDRIKQCNPYEAANAIKRVADLMLLPDAERAIQASLICTNLVELGYPTDDIYKVITPYLKQLLHTAKPTLQYRLQLLAESRYNWNESEEEYDSEGFDRLLAERFEQYPEEEKAAELFDKLYTCAIAVYSSNARYLQQAAKELEGLQVFSKLSIGCKWLSRLFTVLFNAPLLIINNANTKTILAEISGVADNEQLQQLLMAVPELHDEYDERALLVDKDVLDVIKGYGKQKLDKSISELWYFVSWRWIKATGRSDYGIWMHDVPANIPVFEGYRVITLVLTSPSSEKKLAVQRTFALLKASVKVTKVLTDEESIAWLEKFKRTL